MLPLAPPLNPSLLVLLADPAEGPDFFVILAGTLLIFYLVAFLPERKARKKKEEKTT